MTMQSKLSPMQKQLLRNLRSVMPLAQVFHFPHVGMRGVTVVIERTGEYMGRFSVAIAAETEMKYRPKFGEFTALNRMNDGFSLPCRVHAGNMARVAEMIASAVA